MDAHSLALKDKRKTERAVNMSVKEMHVHDGGGGVTQDLGTQLKENMPRKKLVGKIAWLPWRLTWCRITSLGWAYTKSEHFQRKEAW